MRASSSSGVASSGAQQLGVQFAVAGQHPVAARRRPAARPPPLLAQACPDDVAVEALRVLRGALLHALPAYRNKAVMLNSPLPGQGKSFLSANHLHLRLGSYGYRYRHSDVERLVGPG